MMMPVDSSDAMAGMNDVRLRTFLQCEMGFNLDGVKFDEVYRSLDRCQDSFDNFEQFASAVASSIAVHETYFLRHREQFDWIETVWLPYMAGRCHAGDTVRIFSGGCATGEEPYSLYAHLAPKLAVYGIGLSVDAVDISEPALAKARQGRYGLWSLRGVTVESEVDWLTVHSRMVEVQEWVRRGVTFRRHNLLHALDSNRHYDLVLCRNVMIYMHLPAIARTLGNLAGILKPDGIILPGPSDPNPPDGVPLTVHWQDGCRLFLWRDGNSLSASDGILASKNLSSKDLSGKALADGHACTENSEPVLPLAAADRAVPDARHRTDPAVIDTLIRNGHYDSARALLEENIEQHPLDVRSYITLCLLALDLDDLALAEQTARKAAYLEPEALFTVYLIGTVKLRQGNTDAAYAEFMWVWQQLRQLEPDGPVKYCEDISVAQLQEVVHARFT